MARKLSEAEVREALDAGNLGTYAKYPWADWADGEWWQIKQGEDFRPKPEDMRRTLKTHAARHSMQVRVHQRGDTLIFKFSDNG